MSKVIKGASTGKAKHKAGASGGRTKKLDKVPANKPAKEITKSFAKGKAGQGLS